MEKRNDALRDELSAREALAVIRRERRAVAGFVAAVTVIAAVYAWLAPVHWASVTTLYATGPSDDSPLGQLRGLSGRLDLALPAPQPDIRIPDVLTSRRLRRLAVTETWETGRFDEPVDLIRYWGWGDEPRAKGEEHAMRRLEELVHVSESTTGLLKMRVEMPEPRLARDVARFLADRARAYVRDEHRSVASLHRQFVEERLEQTRAELQEAEEHLREFLDANRRIVDSPALQLEYGRLTREVEVRQEVFITLRQQDEIAKIAEIREAPVINVLDPPEIPVRRSRPRRLLIVSLAFATALLLATGGALARDRLRHDAT